MDRWGAFWSVVPMFVEQGAGDSLSISTVLDNGLTVGEALNLLKDIKNTTTATLGLSV